MDRVGALGAALVLALALLGVAYAAPSPELLKEAKAHFAQGKAFQDAGAWDDAVKEYEAAYKLVPLPKLLFNIGQCQRLKGDKQKALAAYEAYVAAASDDPNADEARDQIASLKLRLQVEVTEAALKRSAEEAEAARKQAAEEAAARKRLETEEAARIKATEEEARPGRAGEPTPAAEKPSEALLAPTPAPPKPAPKRRWWIAGVVGGAVAVVALGVGLGVGLSPSNPMPSIGSVSVLH